MPQDVPSYCREQTKQSDADEIADWCLVRTKPRQEKRAFQHLENQSFTVYCPWFARSPNRQEPLFPGYLFLKLINTSTVVYSKVRVTRGVLHFVRFGEKLAIVPDRLIQQIKYQESTMLEDWKHKPGQRVEFCAGPLKGLQGIYSCERGIDRSVVLLTLINREQHVIVDSSQLKKVV